MKDVKTGFSDRITAQQEAKKALLAKFKPKAAAPDPEFDRLAEKRAAEKEALRQQLNAWLRSNSPFDAVIDLDAALRDPADPSRMAAAYDSGDHLHPGDAGNRAMAEAVDLEILLGCKGSEPFPGGKGP